MLRVLHKTHYSAANVDSRKKLPYFDDTSSLLAVSGDFERSGRGDLGLDLATAASRVSAILFLLTITTPALYRSMQPHLYLSGDQ